MKRVGTISVLLLLAVSMFAPLALAVKEVNLEGNEISRWGPSAIPVDEPSYLLGGWSWIDALPDKSEHKYLGGSDMRVWIDGQEIKLHPLHGGKKQNFSRQWYAQFDPHHFGLGEHAIKTVWYQRHEPAGTVDTTFTVYEEAPLLWMYEPRVRSNVVYNTDNQENMHYRLIFSVWVSIENDADIDYVKVTYPNAFELTLEDEGSGWGRHEADDGEYFAVVDIDEPITGDFTFEFSDLEGNTAQITATLDEWLPPLDWVSPGSWAELPAGDITFEWHIPVEDPIVIDYYGFRLGTEYDGNEFWEKSLTEPQVTYSALPYEGYYGTYFWWVLAESEKGNSVHAVTKFNLIE